MVMGIVFVSFAIDKTKVMQIFLQITDLIVSELHRVVFRDYNFLTAYFVYSAKSVFILFLEYVLLGQFSII